MTDETAKHLTGREIEIVRLIGRGMDSRRIAALLGIAYFTVRKHRSNILGKLELHSAAQLAAYAAAEYGICPTPASMSRGACSAHAKNRSRLSSGAA